MSKAGYIFLSYILRILMILLIILLIILLFKRLFALYYLLVLKISGDIAPIFFHLRTLS